MARAASIECLPEEVLAHIFSFLPLRDLTSSVPLVCRSWKTVWGAPPVWRDVTLTATHGVTEEELTASLRRAPHLRALVLRRHVGEAVLREACLRCRRLDTLRLHLYQHVSRDTLRCVVRGCPLIRRLELPARLLAGADAKILGSLRHLEDLTCFTERHREPATCLRAIADNFHRLKRLALDVSQAAAEDVRYLFRRRGPQLVSAVLTVHGGGEDPVLPALAECGPSLRELSVRYPDGNTVSRQGLAALRALSGLKSLHLSGLFCAAPEDLSRVFQGGPGLAQLTTLRFTNTYAKLLVDDAVVLAACQGCRRLEVLELDLAHSKSLTDRGLEALPGLPRLRKVTLRFCRGLTAKAEEILAGCKSLQHLDLTGSNGVLPRGVLSLPRLRVLVLDGCDGTRFEPREILSNLPDLARLSLESCAGLNSDSVMRLKAEMPTLEIICRDLNLQSSRREKEEILQRV